MNELKIINSNDLKKHIQKNNPTEGYIYAIEYGDKVKIGKTSFPEQRYRALKRQAEYAQFHLGRILLSPPHKEWSENETFLLNNLEKRIGNTELFDLSLESVKAQFKNLKYTRITTEELRKNDIQIQKRLDALEKIIYSQDEYLNSEKTDGYISLPLSNILNYSKSVKDIILATSNILEYLYTADINENEKLNIFFELLIMYKTAEEKLL